MRARSGGTRRASALRFVALAVAAGSCVPHPVGPARTFGKYEGKAVTTAESALSAVETARLAVEATTGDRSYGPYTASVVGDAEDAVIGVEGTFGSIQPPGPAADRLRTELDTLLTDAGRHLSAVRIAARRGERAGLAEAAAPLDGDAQRLRDFAEGHK